MNGKNLRLLLCALMLAAGPVAEAQQPRKVPRVGYLAAVSASADAPRLEAFRQGLRDLGYVEGQNIQIDYRHESLDFERLPGHAAELVRLDVDVLVTVTTNAALAAKKTTGTIPIVFMGVTDPITTGLAETLARPGGNSTGITNVAAVLAGKRLELLKETMPKASRVAVLWDRKAPGSIPQWEASQAPAEKLGLQLYSMEVSSVDEYVSAFTQAVKAPSGSRSTRSPIRTRSSLPSWPSPAGCRRSAHGATMRKTDASWPTDPATAWKARTAPATSTGS